MAGTAISWRTEHGDMAGVTVHVPNAADPERVRVVIGPGLTLRLPLAQARALAQALLDAAAEPVPAPRPAPRVIPIHPAPPPVALYHEPEEEAPCPTLPAA